MMNKMGWKLKLGILGVLLVGAFACGSNGNEANVELIQDMMVSPAHKAQDEDSNGEPTMKLPPEGTLPIGHKRYRYKVGEADKAAKELKNPYANISDEELMARGKDLYGVYCGICHGMTGKGDGTIAEKMPLRPPSLLTDQAKNYKDGRFYHIIMQGKGVMGSYANQIHTAKDRWAVINYIRNLQKGN